jgi:shikimate kinase
MATTMSRSDAAGSKTVINTVETTRGGQASIHVRYKGRRGKWKTHSHEKRTQTPRREGKMEAERGKQLHKKR